MSALEKTLKLNPTPLLMFSALRDFSGENISFLIHVRAWKASWSPEGPKPGLMRKRPAVQVHDEVLIRQQFQQAVGIYASFVSLKYSEFPINISSAKLKELQAMFEHYAALVCAEPVTNAATPFDTLWSSAASEDVESQIGKDQLSVVSTVVGDGGRESLQPASDESKQLRHLKMTNFGERLPETMGIPESFDETIFDKAELSIKELVLTNTWAKFVKEGFAQKDAPSSFASQFRAAVDACRLNLSDRFTKLGGRLGK